MTTRADVNLLGRGGATAVEAAKRHLVRVFSQWNGLNPEAFRDLLLELVPALVDQYGAAAATVAAEWYEGTRAAQVTGRFFATTSPGVAASTVEGSVRYAAGHLFTDDPALALGVLSGALQRHILFSSRDTVARNVGRDPKRPRFGRVPTGAKTCAWCTMLASRGFVYLTKETAGINGHYHDDCDCQIVAEWDRHAHHIAGYDPDEMHGMYMAARQALGDVSDQSAIAAEMRRMFPESFTDGVYAD